MELRLRLLSKNMYFFDNKYKKLIKLLPIKKPLVILDVEATGLSLTADKIIEIASIKIWPDGKVKEDDILLNPEIPISPAATAIHGLTDADLKDQPTFADKASELWEIFNNCLYAGFKIRNFDLPMLRREFIRVGMDLSYHSEDMIDSHEVFRYLSPRSLTFAYEYYTGEHLKAASTAPLNAGVAAQILLKQLEKYKEMRDWNFVKKIRFPEAEEFPAGSRHFYWRRGEAYFSFSKYNGQALSQVAKEDREFLIWILAADFPNEVKNVVQCALDRQKAKTR
jgi:DNA polymerase III subunit epsilon